MTGVGHRQLTFLAIGDFGGLPSFPYSTLVERAVANHMAKHASNTHLDFVLTLGDNFYYDGVKNVDDLRFHVRRERGKFGECGESGEKRLRGRDIKMGRICRVGKRMRILTLTP